MHVDMLHRHLLLALAAMPVQSVEQHDIGSGQLVGLVQVLTSALNRLLGEIPIVAAPPPFPTRDFVPWR
jgi:hypothetical protein